jgi:hypothetical protein
MGTVPLPLTLHLATHTVIGLFCMFAGALNLLDPWVKGLQGFAFLTVTAFSWGYVFGILMARREVVLLGFGASAAYAAAGLWQFAHDWRLAALLLAIGVSGLGTLGYYRKYILEA